MSRQAPQPPKNAASAMWARQCLLDRLHHLQRISWLNSKTPRWACGTPVEPSDIKQMLESSNRYLRHGIGTNTGPRDGTERAKELLEWGVANGHYSPNRDAETKCLA